MKNICGFTTTSEAQYESQLLYLPSAGGAKARRAFTLIETMVAVTILTLAVAGPLFTASRAIVAAQTARDQLTASYLAQEGIEYVRMMRDNEYLKFYPNSDTPSAVLGPAWTNFLTSIAQCNATTYPTHACTLDPISGLSSRFCSVESCTSLSLVNGMYIQQSGGVFTRTIQAIDVPASDERIVSTVKWSFHNIPYTVMVTDHLTPWQ